MNSRAQWLADLIDSPRPRFVDGLLPVNTISGAGLSPEEFAVMEKAKAYEADAVFFEAARDAHPAMPQAFVFVRDGSFVDADFAVLHKRLWSWGGVPLLYLLTPGKVQIFRCAHRPDFERDGKVVFRPFRTLDLASEIAADPWWDAERLRNGTLWDDPDVCKQLLSNELAAQKTLIKAVRELHEDLNSKNVLPKTLRRRLLILSVLIAYLEARKVFETGFFAGFRRGADRFFQVLANGPALVALLKHLEERFNGHVFVLKPEERQILRTSTQLHRFAQLVEGRQEQGGQLTLWDRYSFADLPVELISHIYQLFVKDTSVAVYTPHFVVRLMLGEVLSWDRLDRLESNNEVILDGACGSGIFLVEAFKRLVLHWRFRNDWKRPTEATLKKLLTTRIRGVDLEEGAVELAACSLCLALCDALLPEQIRSSVKLFPPLKEKTIHSGCFFEAREQKKIKGKVGVIVGNPPFTSTLRPGSEQRAYDRYCATYGPLPDKQLAYLFLHESMDVLEKGGVLSMVQQYNFLYNQNSLGFRRRFIGHWDVREILDFISVRGMFQKGGADTKIIVVVAEAQPAPPNRKILHATFRRSGRIEAEQGFDIDYYDMHWLPRSLILTNDAVWRADSVGGGRVLAFVERIKKLKTLGDFAQMHEWNVGEGWIEGRNGKRVAADHITGHPYLPSKFLTEQGVNEEGIQICKTKLFKSYYTKKRFTPPILLVRAQSDFHHAVWDKHYLTYSQRIVGFSAPKEDVGKLRKVSRWLDSFKQPLKAYLAATSPRIFTQKSSALTKDDIVSLPYDPTGEFRLNPHEEMIASDIANFYVELIRKGEQSRVMATAGLPALDAFNAIFAARIGSVYTKNRLRPLKHQVWPGVICQPYVFGKGEIDWGGADDLKGKIDMLLREKQGGGLYVTRIARLYDGACIFLLKPDRLRYWLPSISLRDADETLADLAQQGF
jgi:hypothetical protein